MTDEWEQRQQVLRGVFDGVLPSAEQRRKYHISLRDVRALRKFIPIYNEYLRSEIRDLNGDVDEYSENAFSYVGTIDEAIEKGKKLAA